MPSHEVLDRLPDELPSDWLARLYTDHLQTVPPPTIQAAAESFVRAHVKFQLEKLATETKVTLDALSERLDALEA